MKYCHFSGGFRLKPLRFVFEKSNSHESHETVDVTKSPDVNADLRSDYESAKADVEKRLKKYESNPTYKVFVDYAKGRLAQCERDLKKYDVLKPGQIRENLASLRLILLNVRKNELNEKRDGVLGAINERKKYYTDMLSKRFKDQNSQLADMPETLMFAKKLNGNATIKVGLLFNDRARMVAESVGKQMSGAGDLDTMADTTIIYLDSMKDSLTSEAAGSANAAAKEIYDVYEEQVTGEYLHEKARSGDLDREIQLVCSSYLIENDKNGQPHIVNVKFTNELRLLEAKYLQEANSRKGTSSYKVAAVVYGDFLNRFNDVRDKYFPDEAVKDRRDFHVAALARTNAIRTNSEKGWENVHEDSLTDNAGYVPGVDGVVKSDVSLHIGPEEQDLAGIVVDMIRSGTVVNVAKGQPLKVNGVEYVKVQVLDNKHKVVNEGWVAANSITRKFGTKPGKSLEHNGTTTV